jgi:5-methylthioribose kinase
MQYLDTHRILREGLIDKIIYPSFSEHISTYLSSNLFHTSSLNLPSIEKRKLIDSFNTNSELCSITEDYVFTFAFMEHDSNDIYSKNNNEFKNLVSNMNFKRGVLALKYKYMTQSDALLHGDLHTGSIMINENETFIIDPEFSFIGPFGFDIGALIGNLTLSYVSHILLGTSKNYTSWLLSTIEEVLEKFASKFLSLWNKKEESSLITKDFINDEHLDLYKQEFMLNILQDSVGFAGVKMARRMFGSAGVADIRGIKDQTIKDSAIHISLSIAKRFVIEYTQIKSVKDILFIIKDETTV